MSSCIHCALIERPGSCHKHTVNKVNRYTKMTPLTGADLAILLRGTVKNFVSLLKDTSRQAKRMKSLISGYAPVYINIFSVTLSSEHTAAVRRSIGSDLWDRWDHGTWDRSIWDRILPGVRVRSIESNPLESILVKITRHRGQAGTLLP